MMIKRIALTVCAAVFASAAVVSTTASSESENESGYVYSGVRFHEDEQERFEEYLNSLSEEELEKRNRVLQDAEQSESYSIRAANATKISVPGNFTMYQQIYDDYCVPACVRSIINYINGSADSQESIAWSGCYLYMDDARVYLNNHQSKCVYVQENYPTKSLMTSVIYQTITNDKVPCMIAISNPSGENWHYSTDGHALVVNAIRSDKSKIQLGDPLGGYNDWYYFYEKDAGIVSKYIACVLY
ncbi:MAG: hypothetical protein NC093_08495 [Alistipes sp.]|nr:hypothetical protein [Alistipes sp.]